jgi:hypothetical protein
MSYTSTQNQTTAAFARYRAGRTGESKYFLTAPGYFRAESERNWCSDMLKESILLVASTGVLIYLVSPSGEPPKPEPVKEEVQKIVASPAPASDDSWEYSDEDMETDDDNFTFGEPMTFLDNDENEPSSDQPPSVAPASAGSRSFADSAPSPSGGSPRPGAPGSRENPIALAPNGRTSANDR